MTPIEYRNATERRRTVEMARRARYVLRLVALHGEVISVDDLLFAVSATVLDESGPLLREISRQCDALGVPDLGELVAPYVHDEDVAPLWIHEWARGEASGSRAGRGG